MVVVLYITTGISAQSVNPKIVRSKGKIVTTELRHKVISESKESAPPQIEDDRCGTVIHNQKLREKYGEPSIQEFENWMKEEQKTQKGQSSARVVVTIPVVVHVIHNGQSIGGLPNISDAQIQSQIDVLNEDFRRMNADAVNTPADFTGNASDVEIEFCLATVDPQGNSTSGITRYNGGQASYSRDYLENIIQPNTIWHPEYYFNIWSAPLQGGLLGYAQFPSNSALPGFNVNEGLARTDGIVVRDAAFGRGGSAISPLDLGRTATHEVGHFFGLRHIGGDGGCTVDDFCTDTPTQDGQNTTSAPCTYDSQAVGAPFNDCDEGPGDLPDQFMNYMDYSDDACMNLFTNDQKARIDVVLAMSPRRASLVNSAVCSGIPPETVFDPFPYAPANDLCSNAETIDCYETKSGNILYASPFDIPTTCDVIPDGVGVWFSFTGDGKDVNLSLCDSGFDTKINIYSGDCSNLVCVAGNDNGCGLQSNVLFLSTLGVEYYVYVSGFNGATGVYSLTRNCPTALGSSSNILSSLLSSQNQVYANDSLDLVAFIHRQDISIHGGTDAENGILRYDISTDGGLSFDNNVGILNAQNTAARYPQITGYNATNSTNPLDQKLVWTAPRTVGNWDGMINGTADITTASPVTSTEELSLDTESVYFGSGLCQGLPGEFWSFDRSYSGGNLTDSVYLQKGVYNSITENVDWAIHKWIEPDHNLSFDGLPRINRPNISFSPNGTNGWAAFLGDLVGGPDSTWNPVFVKTTDGGVTWGQPIEVNLNSLEILDDSPSGSSTLTELLQENNPLPIIRPTCAFEFDITVDHEGNPHMFVVVGNSTSTATPTPRYTILPDLPLYALDIFSEDGGLTWKAHQVAPINNFRLSVGATNPTTQDNYPQISRTSDGTYIFYSWVDVSDINNPMSQARMAAQRLTDNFITCAEWIENGFGYYPTMAPEVLINEAGDGYNLPIVNLEMSPSFNTLDPVQYRYLGNEAVIYESDFLYDYATIDYELCNAAQENIADGAIQWNQNELNLAEIIDIRKPFIVRSSIENLGTEDLTNQVLQGQLINSSAPFPVSIFETEDMIPPLTPGQDTILTSSASSPLGDPGSMTLTVDLVSNTDANLTNNSKTTEILAIDCLEDVVTLDYSQSDVIGQGIAIAGGPDIDQNGFVVYYNPPGSDFILDSVELIVSRFTSIPDQTITVKIFAYDGFSNQLGNLLFETDLLGSEYPVSAPFVVPVGPLAIDDGRFLVYFGGVDGTALGRTTIPPYAQTSFIVLDGIIYLDNNLQVSDLQVKAFLSPAGNVPIAQCKNIEVELIDGTATVTGIDLDNGSSTHCDVPTFTITGQEMITFDSTDLGYNLVTLEVADLYGNQQTCISEVNVIKDLCQAGDDAIDSDGGGLPDACDCSPFDDFNDNIILRNNQNAGMDFDGIDDHFMVPNDASLIPTTASPMTFEAWIRPDDLVGTQYIATSSNSFTDFNFRIYLENAKLKFETVFGISYTSIANLVAGEWTHIAIILENNDGAIYIDGQLDIDLTISLNNNNVGAEVLIGKSSIQENNFFSGQMEEVRFWNSIRTTEQILLVKDRELSGEEENLSAYYSFNAGTPEGDNTALTEVKDFSTNGFDASLINMAQTGASSNWINAKTNLDLEKVVRQELTPCIDCPENLDISMDFDGLDDHVIIPHDPLLLPTNTNSVTFETWIQPENVTDIGVIASSGVFPDINYLIYLFDGNVYVTGDGVGALISSTDIIISQWTHISVVFDQTETRLFINGVLDATRVQTLSGNNLGYDFGLGGQSNGMPQNWNYEGKMDDTRYWNTARTAGQIAANMNYELYGDEEGLEAYYNFSDGSPNGDNSEIDLVSDVTSNNRDGNANGFAKSGTSSNWVSGSVFPIVTESSALYFDGVDDHLTILNQFNLIATNTQSVTFEAWIYPEKAAGVSMIYATGIFPDVKNQIFLSDDKINITGAGLSGMVSEASIPSFEWSHIAVVFDKTETRLYVNGELDKIRTGTLTSDNMGFNISLGNQENGMPANWNFLGKMDDVRMWGTAQSESQIFDNLLSERTGLEDDLGAYFNFNNGIPEGDNSAINSAPDITGNGGGAVLNNFAKMGSISNWVSSPHRFFDFDADGTPDYCDNCIAPKNLILQNTSLDGIYRATETITLGDNLNFPSNGILTFRAPTTIVPQSVQFPIGAMIKLLSEACEDE